MASRITQKDGMRIVAAIDEAEVKTSCAIRVHVQKRLSGELMKLAVDRFNELGMAASPNRNSVLIYVARDDRQLTIIGDEGIHAKVSEDFWSGTVDAMLAHFKDDELVEGIVAGVQMAGDSLAKIFPRKGADAFNGKLTIA